uniref:Putative ARM repeat superfamily protein n=1 Tax=Helianthus annuus TaxID=4232 RepID=A0A251S057_HELAN
MVEQQQLAGTLTLTLSQQQQQTTDQIHSLISLSHQIKPFSSKWKTIRHKLDQILSIFTSLPPEFHLSGHPMTSLSDTLQFIQQTTSSCTTLAHKCLDHSYTGKLLMQSDLDIIISKFDNYVNTLTEFVTADEFSLRASHAIVVSRPGVSMKKQALVTFNEVSQEDEKYVKIGMEIDGFVNVLLKFLGVKDVGVQEEALKAVAVICGFECYKSVLVGMGVVGLLVRGLESGSELGKELSARCLMKCTAGCDNVWAVSACGGVGVLLKICESGCDGDGGGGELVGLACGVLRNLVGVDEIRRFVIDEGAVELCVKLVRSKNECSQISAMEFLQVLASGNEFVKGLIVNEGGIRVLVRVVDRKSSYSSKAREKSIRALMVLCSDSAGYMNSLKNYGFMDHILYLLHNGEVSVQESALMAASWLSATSDEFKKAMGDAGYIAELVRFLDAKSFEAREIAAETLLRLLTVPRNQKRFVQTDQNVNLLLQMIDPEEGRKKILSSGYLKNIEKLAEDQVLDAKKIIRNLSSSRIRSIIRGIWHS